MKMFLCNNQHLRNICSSINEKLSKSEAVLKEDVAYKTSACNSLRRTPSRYNMIHFTSVKS